VRGDRPGALSQPSDFTNEAIPDHALYRSLEHARFAPSGGNRQGWRVIVVRDPAARRRLADLCVPTFQRYLAQMRAGENPWNTIVPTQVSDAGLAELGIGADERAAVRACGAIGPAR
jgi:nitroreductase